MRTIVDLEENQIKRLDLMGKKQKLSRAELVRRAVARYLELGDDEKPKKIVHDIRGMVAEGDPRYFDGLDALAYEQKIRGEWDRGDDPHHKNWGMHEKPQAPYAAPPSNKSDKKE